MVEKFNQADMETDLSVHRGSKTWIVYCKSVRGPNDLIPISNGGVLVMTADTDAKKAKLDTSLTLGSSLSAGAQPCFSSTTVTIPAHSQSSTVATLLPSATSAQYMAALSGPVVVPSFHGRPEASNHATVNVAQSQPKSKVVHLRNIPSDFTDFELLQFCIPFGQIVNYLLLKGKNQAFVEYGSLEEAQRIVIATEAYPVAIRGRTMFVQYSTHQELKTDKSPSNQSALSAVDETNLLVLSNGGSAGNGTSAVTTSSQLDISGSGTQQQPNAVLRVIIENMICPVTLDLLHTIFSRFGKVLRIITFNKNNTFQALIQISEASAAQHARDALNGHQVYTGCCTLRIDFSKLATLNVKYNNDKSRDYTNPNLPSGELTLEQQLSLVTAAATGQLPASLGSLVPSPFAYPFGAPPAASYGVPQHAIQPNDTLGGASLGPLLSTSVASNAANHVTLNSAVAAGLRFPQVSAILSISPVILVSNLDENKVTPDALFTLFGVYGDVQRVKILFNKKDNALIQFAEPQQAQLAIQHLDKLRWHDKTVRVAPSKHTNVQMPKEGQPDAGLTRDYSQSPLHRFKKPGSKNYMNIYPPSSTLHLSNIPPNITEDFLLQSFEQRDFRVKGFKFFPKDHKMALVQLDDVETAINALIEMHNFKLADNAHLRVSFSKSGI